MKKNNILLVANWKSDVGYAWWLMENFWVEISRLSDEENKKCYLIYPALSKLPGSIKSSSINSSELDYNDNSLKGNMRLLRFIISNNIGCIYLTDKAYFSARYILFRLFGVRKIIVHDHTPGERDIPKGIKKQLKRLINLFPAVTADASIAATSYVRDRHLYSSCIPPSRCYVAKNGIIPIGRDTELHNYAYREFNIPSEAIVIFTSGRASIYKGIDFIIECANILINEKQLNVYFLYCGDGPSMKDFKTLCDNYRLSQRFIFAGARNDVRNIVQSCHIGIQASKGEVGYSLSILEYMSGGLATIVPDNPSVCASINDGENGLVFKENNIYSACEALSSIIYSNSLRLKLSTNAQNTIADDYNLNDTNKAFITIVKTVFFNIKRTLCAII